MQRIFITNVTLTKKEKYRNFVGNAPDRCGYLLICSTMPAEPEAAIAWLLEKLDGNGDESRRHWKAPATSKLPVTVESFPDHRD